MIVAVLDTEHVGTASIRDVLQGVVLSDADPQRLDTGLFDTTRLLPRLQRLALNVAEGNPSVTIDGSLVLGLSADGGATKSLGLRVSLAKPVVLVDSDDITIALETDARWIREPGGGAGARRHRGRRPHRRAGRGRVRVRTGLLGQRRRPALRRPRRPAGRHRPDDRLGRAARLRPRRGGRPRRRRRAPALRPGRRSGRRAGRQPDRPGDHVGRGQRLGEARAEVQPGDRRPEARHRPGARLAARRRRRRPVVAGHPARLRPGLHRAGRLRRHRPPGPARADLAAARRPRLALRADRRGRRPAADVRRGLQRVGPGPEPLGGRPRRPRDHRRHRRPHAAGRPAEVRRRATPCSTSAC